MFDRMATTFGLMTPRQRKRAVAMAHDIKAQLAMGRVPDAGGYVSAVVPDHIDIGPDDDAQDYCDAIQERCDGCALGMALLSYVRLYDGVKMREITVGSGSHVVGPDRATVARILRRVFPRRTLDVIESYFEGGMFYYGLVPWHFRACRQAAAVGREAGSRGERLLAIADNLIANRGRFVLPAGTRQAASTAC